MKGKSEEENQKAKTAVRDLIGGERVLSNPPLFPMLLCSWHSYVLTKFWPVHFFTITPNNIIELQSSFSHSRLWITCG